VCVCFVFGVCVYGVCVCGEVCVVWCVYVCVCVCVDCFLIRQLQIRRRFETLIHLRKRHLGHYSELFTKKLKLL